MPTALYGYPTIFFIVVHLIGENGISFVFMLVLRRACLSFMALTSLKRTVLRTVWGHLTTVGDKGVLGTLEHAINS